MKITGILLLFAFVTLSVTASQVDLILQPTWATTPTDVEASEFVSSEGENEQLFWTFVERLGVLRNGTDREQHDQVVTAAASVLSPLKQELLGFALNIHAASPKVEMYRQLARTVFAEGWTCPSSIAIRFGGRTVCSVDELEKTLSQGGAAMGADVLQSFDHVYQGPSGTAPAAVLYARIGTDAFVKAHEKMVRLAEDGKIRYVVRHREEPHDTDASDSFYLAGYGVELAIKNMEYKAVDDSQIKGAEAIDEQRKRQLDTPIGGFVFSKLIERRPELEQELLTFMSQQLADLSHELEQVKPWQMKHLGYLACDRIVNARQPLRMMRDLSNNFPSLAATLSKMPVDETLMGRVKKLEQWVSPGQAFFLINGRAVDPDSVDPFTIVDVLQSEATMINQMSALHISSSNVDLLSRIPLEAAQSGVLIDVRTDATCFLNNLETEARYRTWPRTIREFAMPGMPGQLRFTAKNAFSVVYILDPTELSGLQQLGGIYNMYQRNAPVRFGVLLRTDDFSSITDTTEFDPAVHKSESVSAMAVKAFLAVRAAGSSDAAWSFLHQMLMLYHQTERDPDMDTVRTAFANTRTGAASWDHLKSEAMDRMYFEHLREIHSRGLPNESVLVNGYLYSDNLNSVLFSALMKSQTFITKEVAANRINDKTDIYDYLLSQPEAQKRFSSLVVPSAKTPLKIVSLGGFEQGERGDGSLKWWHKASHEQRLALFLGRLKYFSCPGAEEEVAKVSHIVVADLTTHEGLQHAANALEFIGSDMCSGARVAIVNNPGATTVNPNADLPARALIRVGESSASPAARLAFARAILSAKGVTEDVIKKADADAGTAIGAALKDNAFRLGDSHRLAQEALGVRKFFDLAAGQAAVIANGRVVKMPDNFVFPARDFSMLSTFESEQRAGKVLEAIEGIQFSGVSADDVNGAFLSEVLMRSISILASDARRDVSRVAIPPEFYDPESFAGFTVAPDESKPAYSLLVLIDPLSPTAQRLAPILLALQENFNVNLRVILNPMPEIADLPLQKYYRYALDSRIQFDAEGRRSPGPVVSFNGLPLKYTLTLGVSTPDAWLVEPVVARYDLDNIRLDQMQAGDSVFALFKLTNILFEGNAADIASGAPPTGLELILGTSARRHVTDTIVMANLGYFQLKAAPGVWELRLKDGRASTVYTMLDTRAGHVQEPIGIFPVVVSTFQGTILPLRVKRQPGHEQTQLLTLEDAAHTDEASTGVWGSLSSLVGGAKDEEETINVFSVASGHLYERFLRTMMVSVLANTKSPVKFWFIKNFLSPHFKDFLPFMAKELKFEYELVTYKWPRWLHLQTEKQRLIWGYKILFLDVIFPLSAKKVIFVDADQTVRADLMELNDMDLKGAPYGFTPFCDSNKDTEGFRFWKHGYWESHLRGLPYHISALFVVDLKRFRVMMAGDTLRGTYAQLSQDPNSLSNLDQDLPNHLQHQVPIFSLPQEWLYCETWCSTDTLAQAKTIDLCNNPLTKTPKLDNARRIVPEWTKNDELIKDMERRFEEEGGLAATAATVETEQRQRIQDRESLREL